MVCVSTLKVPQKKIITEELCTDPSREKKKSLNEYKINFFTHYVDFKVSTKRESHTYFAWVSKKVLIKCEQGKKGCYSFVLSLKFTITREFTRSSVSSGLAGDPRTRRP